MEPSLAFQKAIFAALSGQISVQVYDEADIDTPTPYAQIGDDAFTQDDSHDARGWIGIMSIEVWDAITAGRSRIKGIIGEISSRLHDQALAIDAPFVIDYIRYQSSGTARSDDRPVYRGLVTFSVRIETA